MNEHSGSPPSGEPEYLVVGTLRRPHGVHGEILMDVITDFPDRLQPGTQVFVGAQRSPHLISTRRSHARGLLIRFRGVDSPEAVGAFRNQGVYVKTADRPALPEGHYYHHQLLGFAVVDESGRSIGTLSEILQTGANDVYVIRTEESRDMLLPAIAGVLLAIKPALRQIRVNVPDGLELPAGDHQANRRRTRPPRLKAGG